MNEDNMNLKELEELRESYNLMEEKLDGQEIVTPEQIRAVIEKKVTLLKSGLMNFVIWIYVIGFPLIIISIHFTSGLSNLALWIVGIYTLLGIGINVFLLFKVSRMNFVELDLNTLMQREKKYRRTYLILLVITCVFWIVFAFEFVSMTYGIILIVCLLLIDIPRYYHTLVKSFKTGLQEKYETKPTLLGRIGKIFVIAVLILGFVIMIAFLILNIIIF